MEQFNKDTYKKETLLQEFFHSCLGKVIIVAAIAILLFIIAVLTVPSGEKMRAETIDNIHQCLQENDSLMNDDIDETFNNIVRTLSKADTTLTNPETLKAFYAYNTLTIDKHASYSAAILHNTRHPQGVCVGVGVFGVVISTVEYEDLVLELGPAHGDYLQRLVPPPAIDEDFGENPHLKPYHYRGNPDD
ncbi:MAG: hypothetical protein J1E37_08295 [Prevotella sp.]|nr:hypothetical protein [Prevotella sp.]